MASLEAIGSGLAGALALTAVHETARQQISTAPRMDMLGMQAIEKGFRSVNAQPPQGKSLYELALAGDVVSNAMYYSMVAQGKPEDAIRRGVMLGLAAGISAVVLPKPMGLQPQINRTAATQAMTIGWYLLGGVAAGAAYQLLSKIARR
ncbi:hypothetical protein [Anatilimnocola floriformis]|uniref:hypothetical protein n=1 Tax=Anatilimnocola floriformis TaxID=2948575 RepID=UPI0020C3CDE6|nr:hypothetical protein [Anatilimnocola floriformis]